MSNPNAKPPVKTMEGSAFVDAVLQATHVSASAMETSARAAFGSNSPTARALSAVTQLSLALLHRQKDTAQEQVELFFKALS